MRPIRWFRRVNGHQCRPRSSRVVRPVEALEDRTLLSAGVEHGILSIVGTERADGVRLEAGREAGDVVVFGVPDVPDGTVFRGVGGVEIHTLDGDDAIQVEPLRLARNPLIPNGFLAVSAGTGNDTIDVRRPRGFGFIEREGGGAELCELRIDGGEGDNSATVTSDPEFSWKFAVAPGGMGDCLLHVRARFGSGHDSLIFEPNSPARGGPVQLDLDIDMGGGDDVLDVRHQSRQISVVQDVSVVSGNFALGAGNDVASIDLTGADVPEFRLDAGDGHDEVLIDLNMPAAHAARDAVAHIDVIDLGAGDDALSMNLSGYPRVEMGETDAGDGNDDLELRLRAPAAHSAEAEYLILREADILLLEGNNNLEIDQSGYSNFNFTIKLGSGVNTNNLKQIGLALHNYNDTYHVASDGAPGTLAFVGNGADRSVLFSDFAVENKLEADLVFGTPFSPRSAAGREFTADEQPQISVQVTDMRGEPASQFDLRVRGGTAADQGADYDVWKANYGATGGVSVDQIDITVVPGGGDDTIIFSGDFQTAPDSSVRIVLDGGSGDDIMRASFSALVQGSLFFEAFGGAGDDDLSLLVNLVNELDEVFAAVVDGGEGFDTCHVAPQLLNVLILNCEDGSDAR